MRTTLGSVGKPLARSAIADAYTIMSLIDRTALVRRLVAGSSAGCAKTVLAALR